MKQNVNNEITDRISSIENENMRSFIEDIVDYERDVLALKQPQYKARYRKLAEPHIDTDQTGGD